jgi:hypothetical protein
MAYKKCDSCKMWKKEYGKDVWCVQCPTHPAHDKFPGFVDTMFVKDYGIVSKARVGELRRRVILPDKSTDEGVDYYVGRRSESGKVQDREPEY